MRTLTVLGLEQTKRKVVVYAALLKALSPRVYEKWFATLLRTELVRQLPPFYERGYEYETELESAAFNSYYSGKLHSASQMNVPIAVSRSDIDRVHQISDEFEQDMERILRDLHVDPQPKMERYEWRTDLVAQMLVWTSFNEGKLTAIKEQKQRFARFRTAEDERVCGECFDAEGVYPIEEVRQPPLHPGCRCELESTEGIHDYYASEYERLKAELTVEPVSKEDMPGRIRDAYTPRGTMLRKVRHLEKAQFDTLFGRKIDVLLVNKPPNAAVRRFLDCVDALPKHQLDGLTEIRLINGSGRRGRFRVTGYYSTPHKRVTVYSRSPAIEKTLFHEVAHNIYRNTDLMTPYVKEDWGRFYDRYYDDMPSGYAKWGGVEEGFCESYAWTRVDPSRVSPAIQEWLKQHQYVGRREIQTRLG